MWVAGGDSSAAGTPNLDTTEILLPGKRQHTKVINCINDFITTIHLGSNMWKNGPIV